MLLSLHIENIAVIKSLDLDFSSGFTALTGETGAGKSIIIDSINLLLGAKADKELVRTGEAYAMVSGLFGGLTPSAESALAEAGIGCDEDGSRRRGPHTSSSRPHHARQGRRCDTCRHATRCRWPPDCDNNPDTRRRWAWGQCG